MKTPATPSRAVGRRRASHPAAAGFRPAITALAIAAALSNLPVHAQPAGGAAIHGTVAVITAGPNTVVTTGNGGGTNHSAINWATFSIPLNTTTHFQQPSPTSTSINRVVDPSPSTIFGTLSSNGRLVLVNPAGITVGAGAVVNTASFTASTLGMSEADAIAGRLRFSNGGVAGPLFVAGNIIAQQGDAVLIAPDIRTASTALVEAPNGATILAAGQSVELTGRGLEGISFQLQAPADRAINLGQLEGEAVGIFAGTLTHSGLVRATSAEIKGGKVVLRAIGNIEVSGHVVGVTGRSGEPAALPEGAGTVVSNATITSIDGSITITGQSSSVDGVRLQDLTLNAGMGSIFVTGATTSGSAAGVRLAGAVTLNARTEAKITGTALAAGEGFGSNGISIDGGDSRIDATGPLKFIGTSEQAGGTGVYISDAVVSTSGGPIQIEGTGSYSGLDIRYTDIESRGGNITLKGTSFAGGEGGGYGVYGEQAHVDAGAGALVIDGSANAGTGVYLTRGSRSETALTYLGRAISINGQNASSGAAVSLYGERVEATDAVAITAVGGAMNLYDSEIEATDAGGTVSLENRSAGQWIYLGDGTRVRSGTNGTVKLKADAIDLTEGRIDSVGGQVQVTAASANRGITLGSDAADRLALTSGSLANITTGTLVVGDAGHAGGIDIDEALDFSRNAERLSLVQAAAGRITQSGAGAVRVGGLHADAGSVSLTGANQVAELSGRGRSGAFSFNTTGDLRVGSVAGEAGVVAAGAVDLTAAGDFTQATDAALQGRDVTLVGRGGAATVGKVGGSTLRFAGWSGVTLTNTTAFDNMVYSGGTIVAAAGALLTPGGSGTINPSATVDANIRFDSGATVAFDFNGATHDALAVSGTTSFAGGQDVTAIANASQRPPEGSYTLMRGPSFEGALPSLDGNVANASLAFGSLKLNVGPAPAPAPAPAPPTGGRQEPQDHLVVFNRLFQEEVERQTGNAGRDDIVITNSQCKPS